MKEDKKELRKNLQKVAIPIALHQRLKVKAAREGNPLQVVVVAMLRAQLKVERQS